MISHFAMHANDWLALQGVCFAVCVLGIALLRRLQRRRSECHVNRFWYVVDTAKLSALAVLLAIAFHVLCWLIFGHILYQPSPALLQDLPQSIHAEVIWADKLETLQLTLPITIFVSLAVGTVALLTAIVWGLRQQRGRAYEAE